MEGPWKHSRSGPALRRLRIPTGPLQNGIGGGGDPWKSISGSIFPFTGKTRSLELGPPPLPPTAGGMAQESHSYGSMSWFGSGLIAQMCLLQSQASAERRASEKTRGSNAACGQSTGFSEQGFACLLQVMHELCVQAASGGKAPASRPASQPASTFAEKTVWPIWAHSAAMTGHFSRKQVHLRRCFCQISVDQRGWAAIPRP